jgi:hypothetical protein
MIVSNWMFPLEVRFRCKREVYDRLLTGTQVDFQ